jgi:hypothetical protein
VSYS